MTRDTCLLLHHAARRGSLAPASTSDCITMHVDSIVTASAAGALVLIQVIFLMQGLSVQAVQSESIRRRNATGQEKNLLHYLFDPSHYNKHVRPVARSQDAVQLTFGLVVHEIEDLDDKRSVLIIRATIKESWVDINLKWDPAQFDRVQYISVHPTDIWIPDIVLYNNAGEGFGAGVRRTMAVVRHDGLVSMNIPSIIRSSCNIRMVDYPFDSQNCILKFGSWGYHGGAVSLNLEQQAADLSDYAESVEWELNNVPGKFNSVKYLCCPYPYHDITYTLEIKRRYLYYAMYLIIPCMMISALTLLLFFLPPDCNERMTVGLALLIALSFFFLLVADNMPTTPESVPLIGAYYSVTMIQVCCVFFMTCWVLRFHYHNPLDGEVPNWMRVVLLKCAAWIFCFKFGSQSSTEPLQEEAVEKAKQALNGIEPSKEVALRSANSILAENLHQQEIMEERRQEWRRVALVLNHIFMWLYILTTALSYALIFMRSPII